MKVDQVSAEWAKGWRLAHMDEPTRKLVSQANYDLWYGPVGNGAVGDPAEGDHDWDEYPGFTSACEKITDALETLPRTLFIDTACHLWQETEPQSEECDACDGLGNTIEDESEPCEVCNGQHWIEPFWEDWLKLDRKDLKQLIVGKELAQYV